MHPTELWWLIEGKKPPNPSKAYAGGMSEAEVSEIYEDLKGEGLPNGR